MSLRNPNRVRSNRNLFYCIWMILHDIFDVFEWFLWVLSELEKTSKYWKSSRVSLYEDSDEPESNGSENKIKKIFKPPVLLLLLKDNKVDKHHRQKYLLQQMKMMFLCYFYLKIQLILLQLRRPSNEHFPVNFTCTKLCGPRIKLLQLCVLINF